MPARLAILALALLALTGRAATNAPADPEAVLRQLRKTPGTRADGKAGGRHGRRPAE